MRPCQTNFYPRSPCGERLLLDRVLHGFDLISIHALLAESDSGHKNTPYQLRDFYPRSPCGERHVTVDGTAYKALFLSTLSLRRATGQRWQIEQDWRFLSTLSLRRATHQSRNLEISDRFLSTLSLRRATIRFVQLSQSGIQFLSTLSLRRATIAFCAAAALGLISIHALLAESDWSSSFKIRGSCYFYPRSPCGERPQEVSVRRGVALFLSTLSLRRATQRGQERT